MTILKQLAKLWDERRRVLKEKGVAFLTHKRLLGEEQEIQRQINEILKKNCEDMKK